MVLVGAFRPEEGRRIHFAVPAVLPIEQTVEARRTVEARQTQPVNRPTTGHECAGPAVANQRIVVNGGIRSEW